MGIIPDFSLEFDDRSPNTAVAVRGDSRANIAPYEALRKVQGLIPDDTANHTPLPLGIRMFSRSELGFCLWIEQPPSVQFVSYRPGLAGDTKNKTMTYSITTPWVVFVISGCVLTKNLMGDGHLQPQNCYVFCRSKQMTPSDNALHLYALPNIDSGGSACLGSQLPATTDIGQVAKSLIAHFWMRRYNDEIEVPYNRNKKLKSYEGLSYEDACNTIPGKVFHATADLADSCKVSSYTSYSLQTSTLVGHNGNNPYG